MVGGRKARMLSNVAIYYAIGIAHRYVIFEKLPEPARIIRLRKVWAHAGQAGGQETASVVLEKGLRLSKRRQEESADTHLRLSASPDQRLSLSQ